MTAKKREDPRALRRRIEELEAALRARGPLIIQPADVSRLEAAINRMLRVAVAVQRRHAQQVDQLSQRMQVVVAELGCVRAALEDVTRDGRMDDVPRELGKVIEPRRRIKKGR